MPVWGTDWMQRWRGNHSSPDYASTSVIDQGCELEGLLKFVGTLALNGKFKGELVSTGTLLVGETGQAQAEVHVGVAIISGQVTGNITATERVELRATARVYGDIHAPVLLLQEGVFFDGRCKMKGEGHPERPPEIHVEERSKVQKYAS